MSIDDFVLPLVKEQLNNKRIRCLILMSCDTGLIHDNDENLKYVNMATELCKKTGNGLVIAPNGNVTDSEIVFGNINFFSYRGSTNNPQYTHWRIYRGPQRKIFYNTQTPILNIKKIIKLIRSKKWVSI